MGPNTLVSTAFYFPINMNKMVREVSAKLFRNLVLKIPVKIVKKKKHQRMCWNFTAWYDIIVFIIDRLFLE